MLALPADARGGCQTRTRTAPLRLNNKLFAGLSDFDGRRTVGIRVGIRKDTSNLCFPRTLRPTEVPQPDPEVRLPCRNFTSAAPADPEKSGTALHQSVRAFSVKKALTVG